MHKYFAALREKAQELPDYLAEITRQNLPWQEHFGFDCIPIDNQWIQREPALFNLSKICAIKQLGLLKVQAQTMYDWHVDTYRLSCVNMLISSDHHSHTLFGSQINEMNKEICELKYEPSTYYLFNNQEKHCVVNLDDDRYLLSLYFATEIPYNELLNLSLQAGLI